MTNTLQEPIAETGLLRDEYYLYLLNSDDGNGRDNFTGEDIKTFGEWINS